MTSLVTSWPPSLPPGLRQWLRVPPAARARRGAFSRCERGATGATREPLRRARRHVVQNFHASTDCTENCESYVQQVASPTPFINTMLKLHWTQSMNVPVKIALASSDPALAPKVKAIRQSINDMWYFGNTSLHMKNIPCDLSTVFFNFGVPISETNANASLLTVTSLVILKGREGNPL